MRTSLSADAAWRLAGDRRPEHADDAAVRYVGGFPPDIATRRGFVVISDETRRVRQPTAWLLLAGVMISVFLGLAAMLSNGWAAGVNPATLVAVAAGTMAGPSFADRAAVASHVFTAIPVTAMAVVAVLLATHIGEKVRQARRITLLAVLAQSVALSLGVITWLVSLSVPHGAAKLAFLLDGAVGIMVGSAGLFFSIVTLRSRELQTPAAASQASGGYPGYGYGQPSAQYPAAAGGQYVGQAADCAALQPDPRPGSQPDSEPGQCRLWTAGLRVLRAAGFLSAVRLPAGLRGRLWPAAAVWPRIRPLSAHGPAGSPHGPADGRLPADGRGRLSPSWPRGVSAGWPRGVSAAERRGVSAAWSRGVPAWWSRGVPAGWHGQLPAVLPATGATFCGARRGRRVGAR